VRKQLESPAAVGRKPVEHVCAEPVRPMRRCAGASARRRGRPGWAVYTPLYSSDVMRTAAPAAGPPTASLDAPLAARATAAGISRHVRFAPPSALVAAAGRLPPTPRAARSGCGRLASGTGSESLAVRFRPHADGTAGLSSACRCRCRRRIHAAGCLRGASTATGSAAAADGIAGAGGVSAMTGDAAPCVYGLRGCDSGSSMTSAPALWPRSGCPRVPRLLRLRPGRLGGGATPSLMAAGGAGPQRASAAARVRVACGSIATRRRRGGAEQGRRAGAGIMRGRAAASSAKGAPATCIKQLLLNSTNTAVCSSR
jgi:hypothetical protein